MPKLKTRPPLVPGHLSVTRSISFDIFTFKKLEKLCKKSGKKRSQMIRELVEAAAV